ncbi:unnamed protein product [Vitrella brassicaformis CCMP3155]|uniref:Uncharacterized protein n=1 Tax=Vitrella brassicaformis (strain CCMP3155) TaxID=1169540 RepID=A0A0G4EDS4_VITBC|nr:unnamed protein product [Vitrella brassicaformis CCMP3155]|eukprot:CEL93523.1 unnamed protein product [Vitrella brassicaformis CCMP3155]
MVARLTGQTNSPVWRVCRTSHAEILNQWAADNEDYTITLLLTEEQVGDDDRMNTVLVPRLQALINQLLEAGENEQNKDKRGERASSRARGWMMMDATPCGRCGTHGRVCLSVKSGEAMRKGDKQGLSR